MMLLAGKFPFVSFHNFCPAFAKAQMYSTARDFFLIIVLCFVLACGMIALGRPFAVTWLSYEDVL
jgi:hypothetical protein